MDSPLIIYSSIGYYNGAVGYFSHKLGRGYDFHDNVRTSERVDWNSAGKYSTSLFANKARNIIANHDQENVGVSLRFTLANPRGGQVEGATTPLP